MSGLPRVQTNLGPVDELLAEFGLHGRDGPRAHLVFFLLPKRAAICVPSTPGYRVRAYGLGVRVLGEGLHS
jgi:hypothetical protein